MSTLSITIMKTEYMEFAGYSGSNVPNFSTVEHVQLMRPFDSQSSGAKYVTDVLLRNWSEAYGSAPTHFRFETSEGTDKIYSIRQSLPGEVPDFTSPLTGDWYFKPVITLRG